MCVDVDVENACENVAFARLSELLLPARKNTQHRFASKFSDWSINLLAKSTSSVAGNIAARPFK